MEISIAILSLILALAQVFQYVYTTQNTLFKGSSLSVEKTNDTLISDNGVFSAGFYPVGENAFCFGIWFARSTDRTLIWIANRDNPVNGRRSSLILTINSNLNLIDYGETTIWSSNNQANSSMDVQLQLLDSGNLVLIDSRKKIVWQSFDIPTDTLLPNQFLTRYVSLVSSRSQANHSSGYYKLYFSNDNMLHLVFQGPEVSSTYWPDPDLHSWDAGRTTYNDSRVAGYDSFGNFGSTDDYYVQAADAGLRHQRRLTLDFDGNLRMYSLQKDRDWVVTWQAFSEPCIIHGICGPNSLCSYDPISGRKCTCLPGFRSKDTTDWSSGCEPDFDLEKTSNESRFVELPHVQFHGYQFHTNYTNYTYEQCRRQCLNMKNCMAFLFMFDGVYKCYPKTVLLDGYRSPGFTGTLYLKLPHQTKPTIQQSKLLCKQDASMQINRNYSHNQNEGWLNFLLWIAGALGIMEFTCILLVRFFLLKVPDDAAAVPRGYVLAGTVFNKFSFAELKKATSNFKEVIGAGGSGTVYKGTLGKDKIVAIKRLSDAKKGEAEFLAEMSIIGRLNHMNLIKMWGYCVEGKKRLLVLDFMVRGSLAENLRSKSLNWDQRYQVALGTAKALAYLHEECLEWILHCDVKPHNILLDTDFQPKVADFGLSKLLDRDDKSNCRLSRIRGTRGYMAPEWVTNAPITSKVDVYSYGVVMLEVMTGRSPLTVNRPEVQRDTLVTWVLEKKMEGPTPDAWIEEITDPTLEGRYNKDEFKTLALAALQCVEEDKDARPTMRQVAEALQEHRND